MATKKSGKKSSGAGGGGKKSSGAGGKKSSGGAKGGSKGGGSKKGGSKKGGSKGGGGGLISPKVKKAVGDILGAAVAGAAKGAVQELVPKVEKAAGVKPSKGKSSKKR
jgi:hypothetical protein